MAEVRSPLQGVVVRVAAAEGDEVAAGATVVVVESMKMEQVVRRHARGHRTARESLADLVDPGSFVEYGPLAIAAQRRRRSLDELIIRTPADGLVSGVGTVDGNPTAVLSYDYTVLAGTQGYQNHRKKDRLFDVIERRRLPVVFFAEGGGLGTFAPEDIGPLDVQVANGVVDVAVADEAEAVAVAKRYLSYFAGPMPDGAWTAGDPLALRDLVPENRRQAYDVRTVVAALADDDAVLELRPGFGRAMVTALARVAGQPLGIVANNPSHLGGAIGAHAADKAARFLQLCDAFDLPVLCLCDTPGIMVGPEAEATGLVRHVSRLFVLGANLSVPSGTIILRKGYGLGAQTMAGGSFKAPLFCVAWPTGELGGMGLEG